eukprot:1780474-Alexandrium_andersonii.AAC.1
MARNSVSPAWCARAFPARRCGLVRARCGARCRACVASVSLLVLPLCAAPCCRRSALCYCGAV